MCRYKVGCDLPGKYRIALDSDACEFGGQGRVRNSLFLHGPGLENVFTFSSLAPNLLLI